MDLPSGPDSAREQALLLSQAPEGSAARRLAWAIARHVHLGGGLTQRTLSALAISVGVGLVDTAPTSGAPPVTAVALPSAMSARPRPLTSATCARCGRALAHPVDFNGRWFGTTCVQKVRTYARARTANSAPPGQEQP